MSTPADDFTDADFEPAARRVGSVEELRTSLIDRLGRDEQDSWFIEDLRLFICVRLLQGPTAAEVEEEIVSWGMDREYVVDQITLTRTAGTTPVGGTEATLYPVGATAVWRNPATEFRRQLAARAAARYRLACELVGKLPESVQADPPGRTKPPPVVDLGFDPELMPLETSPRVRGTDELRVIGAVGIALVLFGGALALVGLVYLVLKLQGE